MAEQESVVLDIKEDELEVRDLVDFKKLTGVKWEKAFKAVPVIGDDDKPVMKDGEVVKTVEVEPEYLHALVFITQRRLDPSFTIEDAGRVKVASIAWETAAENPTQPEETTTS